MTLALRLLKNPDESFDWPGVDDEKDIRLLIKGLLEDENFEVATAKNSDEALKSITNKIPDLILLDIWLENSKLDGNLCW